MIKVIPIKLDTHRESFDVFVAGDIHYNDPGCDIDPFYNWRDQCVQGYDNGRKTHNILMGDYCSVFPRSDKRRTPKNEWPDPLRLYTEMRNILKPIASTNAVMLTGNHDRDWWKAENIDFVNWMCAELGTDYGDYESVVSFKVEREGEKNMYRYIDIVCWHGHGGGRTRGGAVNASARPIEMHRTADIILVGHTHRMGMVREQWIKPNHDTLDYDAVNQFIIMTGGYQKGYLPDRSTYISSKMLPPVTIGGLKLTITPFKGEKDYVDVVLHQIY